MRTVLPCPGVESICDVAAELVDVALDHVHADAAAGDVADHVGGGEAGREDQVEDALLGQLLVGRDEAALARLREDLVACCRPPPSSLTSTITLPPL